MDVTGGRELEAGGMDTTEVRGGDASEAGEGGIGWSAGEQTKSTQLDWTTEHNQGHACGMCRSKSPTRDLHMR